MNPTFLGDLEKQLIDEAEDIEDETKTNTSKTGEDNITSIEDTSKKSNAKSIRKTIQRAFSHRK